MTGVGSCAAEPVRISERVVVATIGVLLGGFVGFIVGVATSENGDSVFAIADGVRGTIIGGAVGLALAVCVAYVLARSRPGR